MASIRKAREGEFFIRRGEFCTKHKSKIRTVVGIKRLPGVEFKPSAKPEVSTDGNWIGLRHNDRPYTNFRIYKNQNVAFVADPKDLILGPPPNSEKKRPPQ